MSLGARVSRFSSKQLRATNGPRSQRSEGSSQRGRKTTGPDLEPGQFVFTRSGVSVTRLRPGGMRLANRNPAVCFNAAFLPVVTLCSLSSLRLKLFASSRLRCSNPLFALLVPFRGHLSPPQFSCGSCISWFQVPLCVLFVCLC
jgi:hypothetical protein